MQQRERLEALRENAALAGLSIQGYALLNDIEIIYPEDEDDENNDER